MTDVQSESREPLAGGLPGQVDSNTQHPQDTTSQPMVEAAPQMMSASDELSRIPQWVAYKKLPPRPGSRTKKARKVPVDPKTGDNARVNDPGTWGTVFQAMARKETDKLAGVGFVVTKLNDYIMIDLDNCIDESGQLEPWAAEIVALRETYCEKSPSLRGLRMFARGTLDHAVAASDIGVELYCDGRYATVAPRVMKALPGGFVVTAPSRQKKRRGRRSKAPDLPDGFWPTIRQHQGATGWSQGKLATTAASLKASSATAREAGRGRPRASSRSCSRSCRTFPQISHGYSRRP
jgi:hypothetical protein